MLQLSGLEACFFFELTGGARERVFARVQRPGRDFPQRALCADAPLLDQQYRVVVGHGDDAGSTGMLDYIAHDFLALFILKSNARNLEQFAVVDVFAIELDHL